MIITVTLNAAIDKSLSVPNFRLGRRHRTVEQRTMPGGKGVNVARTLKHLGQPVIATGFAGGATGTRIVEALTQESILSDFVRINEESRTNTAVHDPTGGGETEINERGPQVSEQEVELFRDKLIYLARGADIVVFAGSLPRGVDTVDLRRPDPGAAAPGRDDGRRRRGRADAPARSAPSRTSSRRTCSRPRSSSGHEFNDEQDRVAAAGELLQLGAREAIVTLPDGCVANVSVDGRPSLLPDLDRAARGGRDDRRRATPSWPATSPRATRARRPPSACATASPAAPSPPSAWAPAWSTPRASGACCSEVEVEALDSSPPRPSERRRAGALRRAASRDRRRARCYPRRRGRCRPPHLAAPALDPACAGSFRPPPSLGSPNGD